MKSKTWTFAMALAGLLVLASTADANDTQINVEESGFQSFAAVAHQSTGEAFIVWGSAGNIVGRRFAADGNPIDATDLLIGEGGQRPRIDMNDSGQAVIAWQTSDNSSSEVFARIVPFDGSPPSEPFMVNIITNGGQEDAHVAVRANGSFFIVYQAAVLDGSNSGIALRHYDANGTPLTGEVVVNTNLTQGSQSFPAMDMNSTENLVVSWIDIESDDTFVRFFGSDGTPISDPIETVGGFDQDIAFSDNGQVLIVWGFFDVFAALVDPDGTLVSGPFMVEEELQRATKPTVAALASGDYQAAWTQFPIGETNKDIYTRRILADGTAPEPAFRANRITGGVQAESNINASPNNDYTIVFQGPDSDGTGIYATCLQPDGCAEVFSDGFESGDVTRWTGSMP